MKENPQFSPLWDRWYFTNEKIEYDLHCGEVIEIKVSGRYYGTRMGLCNEGWYVILYQDPQQCGSFVLMRNQTYPVQTNDRPDKGSHLQRPLSTFLETDKVRATFASIPCDNDT